MGPPTTRHAHRPQEKSQRNLASSRVACGSFRRPALAQATQFLRPNLCPSPCRVAHLVERKAEPKISERFFEAQDRTMVPEVREQPLSRGDDRGVARELGARGFRLRLANGCPP